MFYRLISLIFLSLLLLSCCWGEVKILRMEASAALSKGGIEVLPDGSKIYIAANHNSYQLFDPQGRYIDSYSCAMNASARDLVPITEGELAGWFISFNTYFSARVALYRPDGSEAKVLISVRGNESGMHGDRGGDASPIAGGTIDSQRGIIFMLDRSRNAKRDVEWSRIAMFDFTGKFLADVHRFDLDSKKPAENDPAWQTYLYDVEVDPLRQLCYVTTDKRTGNELIVLSYDPAKRGQVIGRVPGRCGIATLSQGRVAVYADDFRNILLYDAELKLIDKIPIPEGINVFRAYELSRCDLESDAADRLYVNGGQEDVTFARWSADYKQVDIFGPKFRKLDVSWPQQSILRAGEKWTVPAKLTGRPQPEKLDQWQVLMRSSDGSDMRFLAVPWQYEAEQLAITVPTELQGFYDIIIRYGDGSFSTGNRAGELYVQRTFAIAPAEAKSSLAVLTANCRRAFRQGEAIPLQLVNRGELPIGEMKVELRLADKLLGSMLLTKNSLVACQIPASLTRRLVLGSYQLIPVADGVVCYPLTISIASAAKDSPFQRILYHEFGNTPIIGAQGGDIAEKMDSVRNYLRVTSALGFTRETCRGANGITVTTNGARFTAPFPMTDNVFAPAEYYSLTLGKNNAEYYLDNAVAAGINYDTQYVGHCGSPSFAVSTTQSRLQIFQKIAQSWGRFPSFYGFNYNDEMFDSGLYANDLSGWDKAWMAEDSLALREKYLKDFSSRPLADAINKSLREMYSSYNAAVRQVRPSLNLTTTPMWQTPAVEGGNMPDIYADMSESYSHWMSEGYAMPWYSVHSAESFKRPGLPMMGVFDNGHRGVAGDLYMKNALLVAARGMQGTGVEHYAPLGTLNKQDHYGAPAYRVINELLKQFGPVFADVPTANEGAILYSYTQDVSERRHTFGTPQWERVYELYTSGLMAGMPMNIICEEDILAGWLLQAKKPRVPMLFLTGVTQLLPITLRSEIKKYTDAGGKLIVLKDPPIEIPANAQQDYVTGFEAGQPAPAAKATFRANSNVQDATCRAVEGVGRNGSNGLVFSGEVAAPARGTMSSVTISSATYLVTPATRIGFWLKPVSPLGRNVCLDIFFGISGTNWLRDMGACDSNGLLLRPGIKRGKLGEWSYFESPIGRWCAGISTKEIMLSFAGDEAGKFDCIIDDVRIFEGKAGAEEAAAYAESLPVAQVFNSTTWACKEAWNLGNNADSWQPIFEPILEKKAVELQTLVGNLRRFPVDTDDLWVSKNQFDGGAVRYLMLATETSPYPWDASSVWSLGSNYSKSKDTWLPKRVQMTFPNTAGVVYDLFDHKLVKPQIVGKKSLLPVDLTIVPGRLFALAPAELASPRVAFAVRDGMIYFRIRIIDVQGKDIAAQVPLRIRLLNGSAVIEEIYRGSDSTGLLVGELALPLGGGKLEISELLGGKNTTIDIFPPEDAASCFVDRNKVDVLRETQLRSLITAAQGKQITFANEQLISIEARQALTDALRAMGISLISGVDITAPGAGLYLALGQGTDKSLGPLLQLAAQRSLFEWPVTESTPGPTRGLICPIFGLRVYGENVIALIGGDTKGLEEAVSAFIALLKQKPIVPVIEKEPRMALAGEAGQGSLTILSDQVGPHLRGLLVTPDGSRVLVTANGFQKNLALLEDQGKGARLIRAERVAQSPWLQRQYVNWEVPPDSSYLSPDGKIFGASGRVISRHGEEFRLYQADGGVPDTFASFGDIGRFGFHQFAVSSSGDVVVAPGPNGVLCWRRQADGWKEAWAVDAWKNYDTMDWPVSNSAEMMPQYHAAIPYGADYVVVLYFESVDGGWVTPENACPARIMALSIADGTERWRVELSNMKELVLPILVASPDGKKILCRSQIGSWGKEFFRFQIVDAQTGTSSPTWEMKDKPLVMTVANGTGWSAIVTDDCLLDMRRPDGDLAYSIRWPGQPVSITFGDDGKSIYLIDSLGEVAALNSLGEIQWRKVLPCQGTLMAVAGKLYVAGWDGRVRAMTSEGEMRWSYDLSNDLKVDDPQAMMRDAGTIPGAFWQANRPPTTSSQIPAGDNLLRNGTAAITVGGTGGWASSGIVQVKSSDLVDGIMSLPQPWLSLNEAFWAGQAGRQVWAEISFKEPTDVGTITVYEDQLQPRSWPTDALMQRWDEETKIWRTAEFATFLKGSVNTYQLNLKGVTRLRYVSWNNYYYNFYTSEIEVRK